VLNVVRHFVVENEIAAAKKIGLLRYKQGVFFPSKTSLTIGELNGFKELGAEVWCVSREGQIYTWFKRALLIWSTSTSYDQKRVIY
jgi:hypothetical protein